MRLTLVGWLIVTGTVGCTGTGPSLANSANQPVPAPEALLASDCDRDGQFSYKEALSFGVIDSPITVPRPMTQAEFAAADKDRNGFLSPTEYAAALGSFYGWAYSASACPISMPSVP